MVALRIKVCLELHSFMARTDPVYRYLYQALESLPDSFERVVFLASLRDTYTGHYLNEAWASVSTPEQVNAALRETHRSVFESVLNLPLITLSRKLRHHFKSLGQTELSAAKLWLETAPYYTMIPTGCSSISRRFFVSQIRLALEILVEAPSWSYLQVEPTASSAPTTGPSSRWLN